MSLISATEAWITGTILGLFQFRKHVPGTDMTVHPETDPLGNWNNRLLVKSPAGKVVAYITVTDTGEDEQDPCLAAGEHLPGTDHRYQECPVYHREEG